MVYFCEQTMRQITSFLQKSFAPLLSSIILPFNKIGYFLTKCAKSHSYVETLGDHADSLHGWIKRCYEEDFITGFKTQVQKAIKHLGVSSCRLAFDITPEPFYGKTRNFYLFNTPKEKKYVAEFRYISVCLLARNKEIPLMAFPVSLSNTTAQLTIRLLEYCQTLFKKIRFAVFDRGFYIGELIDYLEAKDIKYLILVPEKKGKIRDYVARTEKLGKFIHQLTYLKDKGSWKPRTMIVVCKGIHDFPWIFATNIYLRTRMEYILRYKRRWQIETNYRVEDEARIKSKSSNYLIRYFYFLVSLFFHLLWIVNKNIKYYVQFKKYLDIIEQKMFFDFLELEHI
jgi:hypothetical protein